jgi:hypothetical protein
MVVYLYPIGLLVVVSIATNFLVFLGKIFMELIDMMIFRFLEALS